VELDEGRAEGPELIDRRGLGQSPLADELEPLPLLLL
jgi:hypothetical protein